MWYTGSAKNIIKQYIMRRPVLRGCGRHSVSCLYLTSNKLTNAEFKCNPEISRVWHSSFCTSEMNVEETKINEQPWNVTYSTTKIHVYML